MKENSLANRFPHLLEEWDWEKNKALGFDPYKLTYGSGKKAWWLCPKGHSYDAKIYIRTMDCGCPFCAGKRACEDNCLATTHPHIAKEWHPEMNGSLTPKDVTAGSNKRVYWLCPKGHSYDAIIKKRTLQNYGCSYCAGKRVCEDNCLATTHPHIAKEWHPEMNGNLTPKDVTAGSGKRVYWLCPKGHSYEEKINNRTIKNYGCSYCAGKRVCEDNCLATTHPHIAKEWHPEMNGNLTPKDVTAGSEKRVYWLCPKGHSYEAKIFNRTSRNNTGCPKCNQSKGETRIKDFLERFEIHSKTQQTFHDCRNKKPLPFDFIIYHSDGTLALAIEYQGEQHYRPIEYFGGKKRFEKMKKNDEIKRNYCKSKNIPLLEIKYTEFDRIEEILTEKLTELGLLKRQAS